MSRQPRRCKAFQCAAASYERGPSARSAFRTTLETVSKLNAERATQGRRFQAARISVMMRETTIIVLETMELVEMVEPAKIMHEQKSAEPERRPGIVERAKGYEADLRPAEYLIDKGPKLLAFGLKRHVFLPWH